MSLSNRVIFLIICIPVLSLSAVEPHKLEFFAMSTHLEISYFVNSIDDKVDTDVVDKAIMQRVEELDKMLSYTGKDSKISQINQDGYFTIGDDISGKLLLKAFDISKATGGAFDFALGNLIELWDIPQREIVPANQEISKALSLSGYEKIDKIDDDTFDLNGVKLHLGAIAKGEILNEVGRILQDYKVKNYLINAGGDLLLSGKYIESDNFFYKKSRNWKVAISNPYSKLPTVNDSKKEAIIGVFELTDKSIVTSGNYERYFIENDKLYHHILDSKTGYPADSGLDSVTVIADDPGVADAYCTALFVMGKEKGLKFAESDSRISAIFISLKEVDSIKGTFDISIDTTEDIIYEKGKSFLEFRFKR